MSMAPWLGAAAAFGATVVVMPALLVGLRLLQLVDAPTERSSHRRPTLRGGGLAPAVGVLVGLAVVSLVGATPGWWLIAAGAVAAAYGAIGLADDLAHLGAKLRLGLQALVAVAGLAWLARGLSGSTAWVVVFSAGVGVWLVAYVNAFNFMDGINGISAAQAIIAGSCWWAIGLTEHLWSFAVGGALAAGAATGFLPFNSPRAVVFLGDVGSYFFGGLLAGLLVVGLRGGLPPEAAVAPLGLYLADTATTIVRRVRAGETWHQAHRSHAYQRLTQLGWSHTATTALAALAMVALSGLGAVSLTANLAARAAADAAMVAVLVAYLAAPALASRRAHGRVGDQLSPASP